MKDYAQSPYSVECMGMEMFQQARWLAVYGAYIASMARDQVGSGHGSPSQADVERFARKAAALANMVAVANGDPKR